MSAWLSAPAALYVVSCSGREKWMQHNSTLLKEAADLLHKAFGTEHVLGADGPYACMAAIELPGGLPLAASASDAQHLQRILRERFKIEASPGSLPHACSSAEVVSLQCDGLQPELSHAGLPCSISPVSQSKESGAGASSRETLGSRCAQVPISAWEGALWARISAQYYNQLVDYKRLAKAVMLLVKEAQRNAAAVGTSWRSEDFQERLTAEVGTNGFAMEHE